MNMFQEKYAAYLAKQRWNRRQTTNRLPPSQWRDTYAFHTASKQYTCWANDQHKIDRGETYLEAGTTMIDKKTTHRRFCQQCAGFGK